MCNIRNYSLISMKCDLNVIIMLREKISEDFEVRIRGIKYLFISTSSFHFIIVNLYF